MRAVVEGLLAGWAIAIPVGAIGVLILDRATTRGFGTGAAAAAGAASADFLYASVAVFLGGAAAHVIPDHPAVPAISAAVLVVVAVVMLRNALRPLDAVAAPRAVGHGGTAAMFFAMTVINPVTVLYFAALVTGMDPAVLGSALQRVAFAVAAFGVTELATRPRRVRCCGWEPDVAGGRSCAARGRRPAGSGLCGEDRPPRPRLGRKWALTRRTLSRVPLSRSREECKQCPPASA